MLLCLSYISFLIYVSLNIWWILQKITRLLLPIQTRFWTWYRKWFYITTLKTTPTGYVFYPHKTVGMNYIRKLFHAYIQSHIISFKIWKVFEIYFLGLRGYFYLLHFACKTFFFQYFPVLNYYSNKSNLNLTVSICQVL